VPVSSSAVKVVPAKPVSAASAPKAAEAHAKTSASQASSVPAQKVKASTRPSAKPTAVVQSAPKAQAVVAVQNSNATNEKKAPRAMTAVGHRDPFQSPVVSMGAMGSGCSSGKRCLAIDQIALKGVVKSDNGMIAVVVNAMDKAYFLHENDPVFNGYVVKITGDSIVFKETFHDKLGKALTRDVTKMMSRPVA
jgi:Tfp pilus assembly protein PilP